MPSSRRNRGSRFVGVLVGLALLGLPSATGSSIPADSPSLEANGPSLAGRSTVDPAVDGSAGARLDSPALAAPRALNDGRALVQESAPQGLIPVTTVAGDPRCGPGFTSTGVTGRSGFACLHSALDPLPEISQPVAQSAGAAPVCMGNGVNGPRIQLLYMYVEGQPDRSSVMVPRIINEFVPRMESVIRETSKLQGREIGMRLHMPNCKLTVETVEIDAVNGEPGNPFEMYPRIVDRLLSAGYDETDRKYALWFDGGNSGACGIAPTLTSSGFEQGRNPTPATLSNIGWQGALIETAVTFRYGQPILGDSGGRTPECWGRGGTGARTELHELFHNLGAVNQSAPNANGSDAHCLDDNDIMCQVGANGTPKFLRCNTRIEQLDCGSDDYFNARPPVGSYLSTSWNTANSRFLGDAIVHDNVPVEIPRP